LMIRIPGLNRPLGYFLLHSAIFHIGLFGITDVVLNFYFVSLGISPETIGVLQGISRVGGVFTSIPVGLAADRYGPKVVILWSMLGSALSYLPMLLIPTLPGMFISRIAFGIAFGAAFIAAGPITVALVEKRYQSHAFGYYQIVTLAATSFGSFIGGYLPSWIVNIFGLPAGAAVDGLAPEQTPFAYGATLTVAFSTILLSIWPALYLPNQRRLAAITTISAVNPVHGIRRRDILPSLLYLSIPSLLFGLTAGLTFPFYNLFFRQRFSLPDAEVGTILSVAWLFMGVVGLSTPLWERRFGRVRGLVIAMSLSAIAFFVMGVSSVLWLGILSFIVAASVRNLLVPLYEPLRMEFVPPGFYNLTSAIGSMLWTGGWFASSTVSGILQESLGFGVIMSLVGILMFFTGAVIFFIYARRTPYPTPASAPAEPEPLDDINAAPPGTLGRLPVRK
jgi:MFS family permease